MHRAVACRLLQRAACHEAYGVPHTAALIQRTKGGKPYLAARPDTALEGTPDPGPNWNFNVSHEVRVRVRLRVRVWVWVRVRARSTAATAVRG